MALYDRQGNEIQVSSGSNVALPSLAEDSAPVYDTTVKLYKMKSHTVNDGSIEDDSNGFAVTSFYDVPAGYTGSVSCVFKVSEAQKSVANFVLQTYLDDNYVTYWSAGAAYTTDGSERGAGLYWEEGGPVNKVRFTIAADYVDDCYAYLPMDGTVLFAGKNTIYYGMSNVNGLTALDGHNVVTHGEAKVNILQGRYPSYDVEYGLTDEYISVVEQAKNAWMTAHNADPRLIPLIIHTDQHDRLIMGSRGLPKLLSGIVPWENTSKIINLGDTTNGFISPNDGNNHVLGSAYLAKSFYAMSMLPTEKQIHVFGNHEFANYEADTNGGINQYFDLHTYGIQRFDENGFFVVKDGLFNVKYIGVSGFNRETYHWKTNEDSGHTSVSKESMDWLIGELERDDGYDVVILSHYPLVNTPADGSGVSHPDISDPVKYGDVMYGPVWTVTDQANMDAFWAARKDKTAGTVYDTEGNAHEFDFTKVKGNLLCGLHGHAHDDNYCYIESTLLDVAFDCLYNTGGTTDFDNTFHFVLIDRRNNLLNVWKVDGSPKFQNYQIPLDKPAD